MATIYFNNAGTGTTDWNDSNWYDQPGASGNQVSPSIGDTLIFETSCNTNIPAQLDYYITVQNGATLTLNTSDLIQGSEYTMQVDVGGILTITGSCALNGTVVVNGIINISAVFTGYNFQLGNTATCNVSNTALIYAGSLSSSSIINVLTNGSLTLDGYTIQSTINVTNATLQYNNCGLNTSPVIAGSCIITLSNGSTVSTNITIPTGSNLITANATVASSFAITNNGTTTLQSIAGNGSFVNNNICTVTSVATVATLTNNGTLTVTTGTLNIPTFTNNGTTTVNSSGVMCITPASVFTNNGTFNFGSLYSTAFRGRVFPQVPSSASWGNALL